MKTALPDSHPVKLFVGMLSRDISLFDRAAEILRNFFGPIDMESPVWPWEHSDYYVKEMGTGLKRKFVFFKDLIGPETISEIKLKTIGLEKNFLDEKGGRSINLDPGYLHPAKIVLVSTKDYSHRIYLGNGIYGEVTLVYSGNDYRILPHTYPDFRTGEYREIFRKAREKFRDRIKQSG